MRRLYLRDLQKPPRPTHFGIFATTLDNGPGRRIKRYIVCAGTETGMREPDTERLLDTIPRGYRAKFSTPALIATAKIPKKFADHVAETAGGEVLSHIGGMNCAKSPLEKEATIAYANLKENLEDGASEGLEFLLERMCVANLVKEDGVATIKDDSRSASRFERLRELGLTVPRHSTPVEEWLAAMERGMRHHRIRIPKSR